MQSEIAVTDVFQGRPLESMNRELEALNAEQRLQWALEHLPGRHVLSSSFGIQSAVLLHMATQIVPDMPVLLIDTGYLFPETYRFIEDLDKRLHLNLQVFTPQTTPAWQETRFGKLWEQGLEGIEQYNQMNKVEPMRRGLRELGAETWFAGLRREQSRSRSDLGVLRAQERRFKVHPLIDWSNRDVHRYLTRHDLPYHPLWEQGYMSVGDVHTSQPLLPGMSVEETRFHGLKRECGIHE
ncbi:MAG TPA: phosphoadenosine phosphosulfate reductase [Gammaproteobacteria bacterium]|jgi:phosphoadenosine phosphosulfate reductase|nr:phosphoadenosine phosphosulfate reductase [Gammaproteobacteria bacterium]